jgi:hypothetical protein
MRTSNTREWRAALVALIGVALFLVEVDARQIPGFSFRFSLQKATHIVVASEGEQIDGKLSVVESWKGDLQPGDTIEVPELAQFAAQETRTLRVYPNGREYGVVTGDRMVLFLVKSLDWLKPDSDELKTTWLPASYPDYVPTGTDPSKVLDNVYDNAVRMRISVLWIEDGKAYAYSQRVNPGPLALADSGWGDARTVQKHVKDWLDIQNALSAINTMHDPDERVNQVIAFACENPDQLGDAVEIAAGAGDAAIPALQKMLHDPAFEPVQGLLVRDLADVAGAAAGPRLTDLLAKESAFWRKEAPDLEKGWWNHDPSDRRRVLRDRYMVAIEILRALEGLGYPACKDSVVDFRDFWRSQPQLEDVGQMSEECDRVLDSLDQPPKATIKHAWGFGLAASEPDPVRRAESLVPFLDVGDYRTRQRAYNAMSECGAPALPYLRSMLNDDDCIIARSFVVRSLVKAGGIRVGGDLAQYLSREAAFLTENDLIQGAEQWNELSQAARCHYGSLEQALDSLNQIEYTDAVQDVDEVLAVLKDQDAAGPIKWEPMIRRCEWYIARYQ